jgi:hypothetical protein
MSQRNERITVTAVRTSNPIYVLILWHVDPLLGNGREISDYTTAVTRQRP